ncbi:MAG TPA: hypothetical protein VGH66_07330 [Acidimicrobiales bacterium]
MPPRAVERVRMACQRRSETDYLFNFWTAFGWTILTLGFFWFYVVYQLVRRMRDHNARRLELFDAALTVAWEEAGRRDLQEELTPSFQRAGLHLAVMRGMTSDFREPAIWIVLTAVAGWIADVVLFVFLDQDLVKHDQAEVGVEYDLAVIYGRLGQTIPYPATDRVKGRHNYVGRIVASVFSLGFYMFWWVHNLMEEPNRHFETNWTQEDDLAAAVQSL